MTETRWGKYLSHLMGTDNATEAAKKSGISSSNFTRWKKGARADPDFVVKIARSYNSNVLEALVAAEFITDEEAALTTISPTLNLSEVDSAALIEELEQRVDDIKEVLESDEDNVFDFSERQSARPDIPLNAVADSSDYHEEENTEFDD